MNDFDARIREIFPEGLWSQGIDTLQINIGRHCNLACAHCHLECSPGRTEMMSWATIKKILALTEGNAFSLVESPAALPNCIRISSASLRHCGTGDKRFRCAPTSQPS